MNQVCHTYTPAKCMEYDLNAMLADHSRHKDSQAGMDTGAGVNLSASPDLAPAICEEPSETLPITDPCSSKVAEKVQTNPGENLPDGAGDMAPVGENSRIRAWGAWAYSYVPALSRATPVPLSDLNKPEDEAVVEGPFPAPRDLEQLTVDAEVGEPIGSIPSSDTKEGVYDTSTAEQLAAETMQGIGVDPAHRSEVPVSPVQVEGGKGAVSWSLTGLASSAWTWGRGSSTVPAKISASLDPSRQTSEVGGDASIATEPEAKTTAPTGTPPNCVESGKNAGEPVLPTNSPEQCTVAQGVAKAGHKDEEVSDPSLGIDAETSVNASAAPDRPDPAMSIDASNRVRTPGVSESTLASDPTANPARIETSYPSRTAWALAAASQWIPRRASQTTEADSQIADAGVDALRQTSASGTPCPPKPFQKSVFAANPDSYQAASCPVAVAQPVLLTSEALESRQSPLLPSTASMMAATRPNLVLPSFNHTFRRPPRGRHDQHEAKFCSNNAEIRKTETTLRSSPDRPSSPPNMAWRALGAVSHYARGGSKDGGQLTNPAKVGNHMAPPSQRKLLPSLISSGKDSWNGVRRVVIIGVHGWFPNAHVQKCVYGKKLRLCEVADVVLRFGRVIGAPRGSSYFASMMGQAVLAQFEADFGVGQEAPEKVTYIPLDGEGTVEVRVDKWVVSPFGDI